VIVVRQLMWAGVVCLALPAFALGEDAASRASPAAAAAAPAGAAADELEVRSLQERVAELKERIYRTKARLLTLQELAIGGDVAARARAVLVHRNEMGSSFYLESISYALDGAPIFAKADVDGDLEKREEIEIFAGRVVPGHHQLSVHLVYRGHGSGLFSHLEGYRFKVQSSYAFDAEPGTVSSIKVVGFERGGVATELEDRPAVRYELKTAQEETSRAPPAEGARR
jgi:uncharacterized small protein (DUF1192 family)